MANPSRSLNNLVSWRRVLPALGVDNIDTVILPAVTTCPLCQAPTLRVFEDRVVGGQWAHCGPCQFAGDLIELVGRVWDLDIPGALVRLSDLDLLSEPVTSDRVEGYIRDHVRVRQRFNEFWRQAQLRPVQQTPPGLRQLLRRFGLLEQADDLSSWLKRGGRFVGTADFRQVQELFAPLAYAQQPRGNPNGKPTVRRGAGPGRYRLFQGPGWGEVLVMPFFDLPGRLCGFMFAGRDADPEMGDAVYKPLNIQPTVAPCREGGLAMWEAMDRPPHYVVGDSLFVLSDPLVALQLQGRWLRESFTPLPIVATYLDARVQTDAALAHLPDRKIVFWGRNPRILKQAKAANALVSCYPISAKEIEGNLRHHIPIDWLRLILKSAEPWQIILRQQLRKCDQTTGEAILRDVDFTPDELREFASNSDEELRGRLEGWESLRLSSRKVRVRGYTIIESESGWSLERSGELICSAPIRVEEVLRTSEGTGYFHGTVRMAGEDNRFTVPVAEADRRGLSAVVRDLLLERGAGVLQCQPRWAKDSAFIATALGQPKCRTAVDRVGWWPAERSFVFPSFSMSWRGEIRNDLHLVSADDRVPAAHLEAPSFLPREAREALSSDRPEVAILWAVAACVVQNLLAPVMPYYERCAILLDGPGAAESGAAVAKALGCIEIDLRRRRDESVLEQINRQCRRHDWPAVVDLAQWRALSVTSQWGDSLGVKNAILSLNEFAALSLATNPGFQLVTSTEPAAPLGALHRAAAMVMPLYLQNLSSRKFSIELETRIRALDLLHDMAKWFERSDGDPAAVRRAESVLLASGQPAYIPFLRLVYRVYEDGRLPVVRSDCDPARRAGPAIVYCPSATEARATVWVPVRSLNRLLGRLGAPAIDPDRITKSFEAVQAFLGVDEYRGEPGWRFAEWWWTSQFHEYCRQDCAAQ